MIKQKVLKLSLGKIAYENSGNIGKAYRKHDEIGILLCLTIDFETLTSAETIVRKTVTLRERDTMSQFRLAIGELENYLRDFYVYSEF